MIPFEEFVEALLSQPIEDVVRAHVFSGSPHAFRGREQELDVLRKHLSGLLNVPEDSVVIVGSAQTGFSLNPDNFPRAFHGGSDIDVAIINDTLFDSMWQAILRWHYPRRHERLPENDWNWRTKLSNSIYWGWFVPNQIRYDGISLPFPKALIPLRNISTQWFNAFRSLGRLSPFASRDVSGRLYRTWDHALMYHAEGLRPIVRKLKAERGVTT